MILASGVAATWFVHWIIHIISVVTPVPVITIFTVSLTTTATCIRHWHMKNRITSKTQAKGEITMFEFPQDCVKDSVTWTKGSDFMDGSPRYTFEGRDPENTIERFQVVIYTERELEFDHDSQSRRNFYYGYVRDNEKECADTVGRFRILKEAKKETLILFNEYMVLFANGATEDDSTD
jgi:hypothetical protein